MQDNQRQHSGIDMARRIVSAARIAKAAAAGGVHGAAVAAAKEAAPFLAKLAIWALVALIALPMLIFAYLPNIFFGFSSSGTEPVARMMGQAMTLGGFYMDLEDFESTQIDAIVTSLIQQYEEEGIEIDGVEINSDFDEDDLRRFIAISSVAYQQDLEVMTTEAVLSLATSRLRYEPTLNIFEFGGLLKWTLVIQIDHLDPEAFMDQLSFEEDARTWAGALYEVLTESDALEEYAEYYAPYRPNYSGDAGYTGDYEHGGSYSNTIDTSGFVSPSTKNNVDLADYVMQAWENNWGYCWGTYGNVLTEALFNYKLQQYPEGVGKYEDFIRANWLGRRTADCIGLIKGYGWLDAASGSINYGTNGMPDVGADQMYANAQKAGMAGTMDTMPELVGIALWKQGHIGVYVGNGYAVGGHGYQVRRSTDGGRRTRLAGLVPHPLHRIQGDRIMYVPTRLRVLRIKYKITLKALAGRMNISNQHLSRMELADIPPTEYHEHLLCLGMERLLAEWDSAPEELKQEYQTYKGRLLQPAKEVEDEY